MNIYFIFHNLFSHLLTFTIFIWLTLVSSIASQECTKIQTEIQNTCKCQAGSFKLDLSSLVKDNPTAPLFKDVKVSGGVADAHLYSYQPCGSFTCDPNVTPSNAAVCQSDGTTQYIAGYDDLTKINFIGDPRKNELNISYEGYAGRTSIVMVRCGSSTPKFTALGEGPTNKYTFELLTSAACYSGGLSAGSVLLIIFFVCLAVYFALGLLYRRFVCGARGAELLIHGEFWRGLPGAARDGARFAFSGCKTDTTYSQI